MRLTPLLAALLALAACKPSSVRVEERAAAVTALCQDKLSYCTVAEGWQACTDTRSDHANCGGCGNACAPWQLCQKSKCSGGPSCGSGQAACYDASGTPACFDVQTDRRNCGACGIACALWQTCDKGQCTGTQYQCADGRTACDDGSGNPTCVSTKTSRVHCGACGNACSAWQTCESGKCTGDRLACADGRAACESGGQLTCVETRTDRANCGGCGVACLAVQSCVNGKCSGGTITCDAGRSPCLSTDGSGHQECKNLASDMGNCGACGVSCFLYQTCTSGKCVGDPIVCAPGQAACSTGDVWTCRNVQTDRSNCGTCGAACSLFQSCVAGQCQGTQPCAEGESSCTSGNGAQTCTNLGVDEQNCGACGTACAAGDECLAGSCRTPVCGGGDPNVRLCETQHGGLDCVNVMTSRFHCGGCGKSCFNYQTCESGVCTPERRTCAAPETACPSGGGGEHCTNLAVSVHDCGTCGTACGAEEACIDGQCFDFLCADGYTKCDNVFTGQRYCADKSSDPQNCGACGNVCGAGASCIGALCVTPL